MKKNLIIVLLITLLGCKKENTVNQLPSIPINQIPTDNATDVTNPLLQWDKSIDPEGDEISYNISWGVGEESMDSMKSGLKDNSFNLKGLKSNTKYYWQISICEGTNNIRYTTGPVWSFTTGTFSLKTPALISPRNNSIICEDTLKWSNVSSLFGGSITYSIQFGWNNQSFNNAEWLSTGNNNYIYQGATATKGNDIWYWRVKAQDNYGNTSSISSTFCFKPLPAYYSSCSDLKMRFFTPNDLSNSIQALPNFSIPFDGTNSCDGAVNTRTIVDKFGSGNYPAYICDTLTYGGYNDWYLPSENELRDLESYQPDNVLGTWYWSSTFDGNYARVVYLGAGSGSIEDWKYSDLSFRCIRKSQFK